MTLLHWLGSVHDQVLVCQVEAWYQVTVEAKGSAVVVHCCDHHHRKTAGWALADYSLTIVDYSWLQLATVGYSWLPVNLTSSPQLTGSRLAANCSLTIVNCSPTTANYSLTKL